MSRLTLAVVVVVLVGTACAGTEATPTSPPSTTSVAGEDAPVSTPVPSEGANTVEDYLVSLSNRLGEAGNLRRACEEEMGAPGVDTEFDEVGEESVEGAQPEGEQLEFLRTMFEQCFVGTFVATTDAIRLLSPPPDAATAHTAYVAARETFGDVTLGLIRAVTTVEEGGRMLEDPAYLAAIDTLAATCRDLEVVGLAHGFTASLECPQPQTSLTAPDEPDIESIHATIGASGWSVEPSGLVAARPRTTLEITNVDDRAHRPVILDLFSGAPDRLPVRDGLVDLSQSGVVSDAAESDPDHAYFGMTWPEPGGEGSPVPDLDLQAGDTLRVELLSGTYVLVDQLPGAYARGDFAVIVVVDLRELEATYVAPPQAASTCGELGAVAGELVAAYMDEVMVLTADQFSQSSLSMVDDLRFGGVVARIAALSCRDTEIKAAVAARVCGLTPPPDSAAAVVQAPHCG